MRYLLCVLCLLLTQFPAHTKTLPNDLVTIIKTPDYNKEHFKIYKKAFKHLNLSPQIRQLISKIEKQNKRRPDIENSYYRERLTRIRIVSDTIQKLWFSNAYGDAMLYSIQYVKNKKSLEKAYVEGMCSLTITGNGFADGGCTNVPDALK